jgi:DHA2 family multidrug resistance protein
VLNTYITDMERFHRTDLVSNLTATNPLLTDRLNAISQTLIAHGYSASEAASGAMGVVNGQIQQQAAVMSFNDGFLLLGICFIVAAPAILLLRVSKASGPSGAGH